MPAAAHRTFAQCCSGLGWQRPHTSAAPVATATKKRATKVPHRGRPLSGGMPLPPPASATERRRSLSGRGQRLRRLPAGAQRARRSIDGHSPAGRRRRRRAPRRVLSATPGRGSEARRTCLKPAMRAPGGPPTRRPMLLGSGNLLAGRRGARSLWVGGHTTPKTSGDPPNSAKSRELESPWTDGDMAPRSTAVQSPLQSGL
jgi:hypothetical protein